jgi:heme-degrading monooxygenase HmoA
VVQFIWEFVARPDKLKEFERHYSASGPWVELFRRSAGYKGTQLLRDSESARRCLTIDRWDSVTSYRAMRDRFAKEYEELDRICETFTDTERNLGVFEEA